MNIIALEKSNPDDQPTVVHKGKRKIKSNPNIQRTKHLEKKMRSQDNASSSSDEDFRVTYKSNKSAVPAGPSDQGATATIVGSFICYVFANYKLSAFVSS